MHDSFKQYVNSLHPLLERLVQMSPVTVATLPTDVPYRNIHMDDKRGNRTSSQNHMSARPIGHLNAIEFLEGPTRLLIIIEPEHCSSPAPVHGPNICHHLSSLAPTSTSGRTAPAARSAPSFAPAPPFVAASVA
jgi:hypothetical protein